MEQLLKCKMLNISAKQSFWCPWIRESSWTSI